MRIAWLCAYPVDILPKDKVRSNPSKVFHPATWAVNLAGSLSKEKNIELHIVTETPNIRCSARFRYNDIFFHILKRPYCIPLINKGLPSSLLIGELTKYYLDKLKFENEINKIKPDLIHAHGTETRYSYIASKMKSPVLVSMQGIVGYLKQFLPGKGWNLREKMEIETIKNSRFFISRADFTDSYIRKYNDKAQIFHLDDMVTDEFFNMPRKPVQYRLFFAGSVLKSKGIEDLLTAFVYLTEKYKKMELRIAGSYMSSYKEDLINKMDLYPFGSRIKFLGHLDRKEMLREYSETDVFVFPSYFETSPNVIMEAMSMGLPIVSTYAGGIPDMIKPEKNGLLVKTGSPYDLAHSIAFLFENREQALKLGTQAKRDALQRFKREIVTEKTLALYEKILAALNIHEK